MRVLARTIDGAVHFVAAFPSASSALAYLRRAADEARACGHRRIELDEDECTLVLEYGGDDTVMLFAADDEIA